MAMDEAVAAAAMLVLARESRGLTQAELAAAMIKASPSGEAVSQGYVSRAESARLTVSGERLALYAQALGYPVELLALDPTVPGTGVGLVHHRKKAALTASSLRCVHAQLALTRLQVEALAEVAGRDLREHQVPAVELNTLTTPKDAARSVRMAWQMPSGPVPNMIGALEEAGVLVLVRDLGSAHLDAVSQFDGARAPLVLVNFHAPVDRCRFSLAHELGHLVLHHSPGGADQERQADAFAAEFLMPSSQIRSAFAAGLDLGRLAELKKEWRVSMSALLRRAQTLNAITEWQYRSAMIEMSALGYRITEPVTLPSEQPIAVDELVKVTVDLLESVQSAAHRTRMLPEDFTRLYAPHCGADPSAAKART